MEFTPYPSSFILGYYFGSDFLLVLKKTGDVYVSLAYFAKRIGEDSLAEMKILAGQGKGLEEYLETHKDIAESYSAFFKWKDVEFAGSLREAKE
ncbi:MAG: hypothetical protein SPG64_05125 [Candidatus Enteromonas sp.]|nr:hypothetical protein [Candidatus Enteromonas sp.]